MTKARGFTLIELVVVIAIIGVLTAIAMPAYNKYLVKSNRRAAQSYMLQLANYEEQYFANKRTYVDYATLTSALSISQPSETSGKYTFTISTVASPPSFTVTATAAAGSSQASDGNLTLGSDGSKTPSGKW